MTNPSGNRQPNPSWNISLHPAVSKIDIPRLGRIEADRVRNAIEHKIAINPILYGLPLHGTLKKHWKIRVGDLRIIYEAENNSVWILAIAHRRNAYEIANKRIN